MIRRFDSKYKTIYKKGKVGRFSITSFGSADKKQLNKSRLVKIRFAKISKLDWSRWKVYYLVCK